MVRVRPIQTSNHSFWPTKANKLSFLLLSAVFVVFLIAPPRAQVASPPSLITKVNSTRAVAVESNSLLAEPFAPTAPVAFGQDSRTRITLFANNLNLAQGETASAVTADAEDGNHIHYSLTV